MIRRLLPAAFAAIACVPPQASTAPDPVTVARVEALESRSQQLAVAIARLEERIAMLLKTSPGVAQPQASEAAQASLGSTATQAPAAAPQPPASAPQRGPKGGCYVITGSGKKRYVSRDRCG